MSRSTRTSYNLRETPNINYKKMEYATSEELQEVNLGDDVIVDKEASITTDVGSMDEVEETATAGGSTVHEKTSQSKLPQLDIEKLMSFMTSLQQSQVNLAESLQQSQEKLAESLQQSQVNLRTDLNESLQQSQEKLAESLQQSQVSMEKKIDEVVTSQRQLKEELSTQLRQEMGQFLQMSEERMSQQLSIQLEQRAKETEERLEAQHNSLTSQVEELSGRLEQHKQGIALQLNEVSRKQEVMENEVTTHVQEEINVLAESLSNHLTSRIGQMEKTRHQDTEKWKEQVNVVVSQVQSVEQQIERMTEAMRDVTVRQVERVTNSSTTERSNLEQSSGQENRQSIVTPTNTTNVNSSFFHHPAKMWAEQVPKFEGKVGENPMNFLVKLEEYANLFGLTDAEIVRCLSMVLRSNAYYWFEVVRHSITSYADFKEKFLNHFWNKKVQGNLRAQLHAEKFAPGKGKGIEAHISEMYERSRHLEPPISNEEFISMVLHQLPYRFQAHWTGRQETDLTTFREDLVNFDRIERLQRQNNQRETESNQQRAATPPQQPLYTNYQQREFRGPNRFDREPRVQHYAVKRNEQPEERREDRRFEERREDRRRGGYTQQRPYSGRRYNGGQGQRDFRRDSRHYEETDDYQRQGQQRSSGSQLRSTPPREQGYSSNSPRRNQRLAAPGSSGNSPKRHSFGVPGDNRSPIMREQPAVTNNQPQNNWVWPIQQSYPQSNGQFENQVPMFVYNQPPPQQPIWGPITGNGQPNHPEQKF